MNAQSPSMAAAAAAPVSAPAKPAKARRKRLLMISLPLALAIAGGAVWLTGGRYVTTDNAYVHQPMVAVSADVSGRVTEVTVGENQHVAAGDELFALDPVPYQIALAQAEAALASARLNVAQLKASYASAQAQLAAAESILEVQEKELERQRALTSRGVGSQADLDDSIISARNATNNVAVAKAQLEAAASALNGNPDVEADALPSVQAAMAARDAAARNLAQTRISAASAGTIAQLESLNVGQYLSAGSQAAVLLEPENTWIVSNFKETQLETLRVGQPVEVEVDAYPGVTIHGSIESFGPATGSQFSLIPAQNATGNWVKVVQRVPVRIRLDGLPETPLRDGMSVHVSVDTGSSRLDNLL
ncbi:HlyD family secretion protein [Donghicola mangrovi]|uniref:HlyD family secretion protein n=1 Tax=Donghicola mangrovi TaxID=2729614 RepID=A0A850Q7R2_9RHOB|nr:HlyD family secretion protein [Donghicola mangrovi]NVO24983.1 HlyD family secretion protein [Donghicola mangrovi]